MAEPWRDLVERAQAGDRNAFDALVRAFRDMAVGYAYSILRDFHAAEDAAQEAFVQVYLDLARLRHPAAFPTWLRRIVFKYCDRQTRRSRPESRPFDPETDTREAAGAAAPGRQDGAGQVLDAVGSLPENERAATTLFYINGYSMEEVGQFLDVPVSTVRSRLYTARRRLRGALAKIVESTMKSLAPGEEFSARLSHVLDGVVRVGFYDGRGNPEDYMLPSVMRTLLEYLNDDGGLDGLHEEPRSKWQWSACALMHGVSGMGFRFAWATHEVDTAYVGASMLDVYRDVLNAAGFDFQVILKPDFAAGLKMTGLVSSDEDLFRSRIVESIRSKMPVIGLRLFGPPEPGVIAGFEGEGEVILGWDHFQDLETSRGDPRVSYEPSGMFRKRNWFRDIGGIIVIVGRCPRPSHERVYREALVRIHRDTTRTGAAPHPFGVAAYEAWISALTDEGFPPPGDTGALRTRHQLHHEAVGDIAQRRAYASEFLLQASQALPAAHRDLDVAASCLLMMHDLCWRLWQTVGDWRNSASGDPRFVLPGVRRELASLVVLFRDLDHRVARHIHAALTRLGETDLAEIAEPPAAPAGLRRLPYFTPGREGEVGPSAGGIRREAVSTSVAAERFPLMEPQPEP
jgi:RNA polymerase sigma factor (sigma-70 family)